MLQKANTIKTIYTWLHSVLRNNSEISYRKLYLIDGVYSHIFVSPMKGSLFFNIFWRLPGGKAEKDKYLDKNRKGEFGRKESFYKNLLTILPLAFWKLKKKCFFFLFLLDGLQILHIYNFTSQRSFAVNLRRYWGKFDLFNNLSVIYMKRKCG